MQRSVEIFKFDVWKVWKAACDAEKEKPWIIENTKYEHKCFLKDRRAQLLAIRSMINCCGGPTLKISHF